MSDRLEMVKVAAFQDELEKLGGWGALLKTVLTKYLPKVLGTTGKGVTGSTGKFLARHAKSKLSAGEILSKGIKGAAKKYGPYASGVREPIRATPKKIGPKLTKKTRFGNTKKLPSYGKVQKANPNFSSPKFFESPGAYIKSKPKKWMGEISTYLNTVKEKGLAQTLKQDLRSGSFKVHKGNYYKKGPVGRLFGTAFTGTGIGAAGITSSLAQKKTPGGKKMTTGRRAAGVGKSAVEGALWTAAPGLAMTAMVPGMVFNAAKKKKPTKNLNNNYNY